MNNTIKLEQQHFTNRMSEPNTKISETSKENFVRGNNVYILGPFDRSVSAYVIPDLIELLPMLASTKEPELNIYINSYGGYCAELLSLLTVIEMMKQSGIRINTYNLGVADSCGSMLAVIGDRRYMYRYATNLPHLGTVGMEVTTMEQLNRSAEHASQWFNTIFEIYAKYTKMQRKQLEKILKDDQYHMSADECVKNGFCDEII